MSESTQDPPQPMTTANPVMQRAEGDYKPTTPPGNEENSKTKYICRLRKNWFVVTLLSSYLYSGYCITFPTLHQYLTIPSNNSCGDAGLGSSEIVYSLAAGMFSAGEIGGALLVSVATQRLGYAPLFVSGAVFQTVGFLIYGCSIAGWMVVIARILVGVNSGIIISLPFSYFGQSVAEYSCLKEFDTARKEKFKNQLIYVTGLVISFTFIPTLGIVLVVGQFPLVDQFRWVAWFQVVFGVLSVVATVALFREPLPSYLACGSKGSLSVTKEDYSGKEKPNQEELPKRSISLGTFLTIFYVVMTGYVINSYYSVLDSLANPILADYYGMNTQEQTLFFLGVTALVPVTCLVMVFLVRFHVDTRCILFVLLVLSTAGLLLLGDWQTLGSTDQCNNFSIEADNSHSHHVDTQCSSQPCAPFGLDFGQVCENASQNGSTVSHLAFIQLNVSLYPAVLTDGSMQWPNASHVPYCPPCSDSDSTGLCIHASINNGHICAVELTQQATSSGMSSICTNLFNHQARLCITIGQEISAEELSSSCPSLPATLVEDIVSLPFASTLQSQQQCEDHSMAPYYCYWNQDSLLTGKHCSNCSPLCRSTRKIPHFVQVFLSMALLTIVAGAGVWVIAALLVRVTPAAILPRCAGICGFLQALARLLTPIWGNLVYVATGRHTVVPLSVMLAVQVPALLGLVLAWRRMATGGGDAFVVKVLSQPSTEKLTPKTDDHPVHATNLTFFVTPC